MIYSTTKTFGLPASPSHEIQARMSYRFRRRRVRWLEVTGFNKITNKEEIVKWRGWGLLSIFALAVLSMHLTSNAEIAEKDRYSSLNSASSRHLLANSTTSHLPAWEQCTFEMSTSSAAWVFSHSICILVIFVALAIICDDFFVPSLEIISEKLNLSEDVAGATFMAAGSSAPELFSSVAGVASESDVGVGTIVGSAVFNLLIIIALTAALAGQDVVLHLDWRPLMRDAFFYAMSIGCFIGFAWDGYFMHYEAVILLVLYSLYIVLMVFNPRLMDWLGSWSWCCKGKVEPSDEEDVKDSVETTKVKDTSHTETDSRQPSFSGGHARRISIHKQSMNELHILERDHRHFHHHRGSVAGVLVGDYHPHESDHNIEKENSVIIDTTPFANGTAKSKLPDLEEQIGAEKDKKNGDVNKNDDDKKSESTSNGDDDDEEEETMSICPCLPCCPLIRTHPPSAAEARSEGGCWNWFKIVIRWFLFIPAFPFVVLFSWTVPDCSKDHLKKWYIVSFIVSVFWIAMLSFGMVTLVGRIGCILNIDTYIMGLVIVAVGTSIPDALSSILVARDGYGDMAVSNAIGSNVFDINLGLGLPFLIRIAIDLGDPINLLEDGEWGDLLTGKMLITPHAKFGFLLLLILIVALTIFFIAKFRLNKWIGISFVSMYVMFLAYAFTQELYCVRSLKSYC